MHFLAGVAVSIIVAIVICFVITIFVIYRFRRLPIEDTWEHRINFVLDEIKKGEINIWKHKSKQIDLIKAVRNLKTNRLHAVIHTVLRESYYKTYNPSGRLVILKPNKELYEAFTQYYNRMLHTDIRYVIVGIHDYKYNSTMFIDIVELSITGFIKHVVQLKTDSFYYDRLINLDTQPVDHGEVFQYVLQYPSTEISMFVPSEALIEKTK